MANNLADLRTVLDTCGIPQANRDAIIQSEGFTSIADLGLLDGDKDVTAMAQRLASRTPAAQRIILGTVAIKKLQALVYWVKDRQLRSIDLTPADFNAAAITTSMEAKRIRKELKDSNKAPAVKDLTSFNPDKYESCEDAFLNLLSQTRGAVDEPLRYVVRDEDAPDDDDFNNENERRMYQLPLEGDGFDKDNRAVYRKLKEYLIDTDGYPWIEDFDTDEDGRGAFQALQAHYNGTAEVDKRTKLAKAELDKLYYKNEKYFNFDMYSGKVKSCIQTINKNPDFAMSARQQVAALLKGLNVEHEELKSAKTIIRQSYPDDFTGACAFFSGVVSDVYGAAQVEYRQGRNKRKVSSLNSGNDGRNKRRGGRGGGRGRGRGRGRGGGRGGGRYGGRGGGRGDGGSHHYNGGGAGLQTNNGVSTFNGVDVTNPDRSFSGQEWDNLQYDGRQYIFNIRDQNRRNIGAVTSGGGNAGGDGNGNGDGNTQGNGDRGGRNGQAFGRGAYGNGGGRGSGR